MHLPPRCRRPACVSLAQDELLFAFLELVLGAPDEFVDVCSQAPALHDALSLDHSHAPCLDVALDAIEHWASNVTAAPSDASRRTMEPLMQLLMKYIGRVALVEQEAEQSALVVPIGLLYLFNEEAGKLCWIWREVIAARF